MAWIKALHVTFLLIWCAGLFYMPGLFSAYSRARTIRERHQLRIVTRFSFIAVASPAAVLAIVTGSALVYATSIQGTWLPAKLLVVSLMVFFHLYCGRRVVQLENGQHMNKRYFHLALLCVPAVLIPTVLWLVLAKPALSIPLS